ncbi:hypothetical protein V8C35DRAFT_276271 [Trichoderma chlorosporum]
MNRRDISSNTFGNDVRIYQGDVHYTYPSEAPESRTFACRDALFLTSPAVDRDNLKSAKGERTDGTCEWIRNNTTYLSWVSGDLQRIWISGGPGKGKTMLSIFLTEELERRTGENKDTELLLYYFCAPDEKHNSAVAVLRSLAYQLVSKRPSLARHILPDFESPQKTQETLRSPNALWVVLTKLLQAVDLSSVFCVLDGLDECDDESIRLLVSKFCEYCPQSPISSSGQFKLVIVSRKIDRLDAFPQVKLDPDNDDYVNGDIRQFISSSVQRLERIQGFNNIRKDVETTLLDRAQGTFLWVGFVVEELSRKKTCIEIMETLHEMPRGLHAIYRRMLEQIDTSRRNVIFAILRWVTIAFRPLTVSELMAATHIPTTTRVRKELAILDYIALCGHILTIQDQKVSLVHQSARDYLLRKEAGNDPVFEKFQIKVEEAHARLAERCIDYLEKSDFRNSSLDIGEASVLQKSPLLHYATMHWSNHASQCPDTGLYSKTLFRLSRAFFQEKSIVRMHWWEAYLEARYYRVSDPDEPLLHIASYLGIKLLVQKLLTAAWNALGWRKRYLLRRVPPAVNQKDRHNATALSLAADNGHLDIVQLLLANGADDKDGEALSSAADNGHLDIVQLLLANGADDKSSMALGWALRRAAGSGHLDILQLLLANGADYRYMYEDDETLVEAVQKGFTDIVQLLLVNGAYDKDSEVLRRALGWAVGHGDLDVVQLLLASGADDKDGQVSD